MITLKTVLRANAASCIIFALLFLIKPGAVASFLNHDAPIPATLLQALGVILMVNGLHIVWASFKPLPSKLLILYFSLGDFIWFFASTALVVEGTWISSTSGITVSTLIAVMVAVLGVLQIVTRKNGAL